MVLMVLMTLDLTTDNLKGLDFFIKYLYLLRSYVLFLIHDLLISAMYTNLATY